jgi:hypothetical protein
LVWGLGADREEVADERERRRAGDEHAHAAVLLGGRQVPDPRDERLRARPVGALYRLQKYGRRHRWAIATATYLVLRQDVDGTQLDEVVLDEPGSSPEQVKADEPAAASA